jgi:hypothetical protein
MRDPVLKVLAIFRHLQLQFRTALRLAGKTADTEKNNGHPGESKTHNNQRMAEGGLSRRYRSTGSLGV